MSCPIPSLPASAGVQPGGRGPGRRHRGAGARRGGPLRTPPARPRPAGWSGLHLSRPGRRRGNCRQQARSKRTGPLPARPDSAWPYGGFRRLFRGNKRDNPGRRAASAPSHPGLFPPGRRGAGAAPGRFCPGSRGKRNGPGAGTSRGRRRRFFSRPPEGGRARTGSPPVRNHFSTGSPPGRNQFRTSSPEEKRREGKRKGREGERHRHAACGGSRRPCGPADDKGLPP